MAAQNEADGHDTEVRELPPGPLTFCLGVNGLAAPGPGPVCADTGPPVAPMTVRADAATAVTLAALSPVRHFRGPTRNAPIIG